METTLRHKTPLDWRHTPRRIPDSKGSGFEDWHSVHPRTSPVRPGCGGHRVVVEYFRTREGWGETQRRRETGQVEDE